MQLKVDFFCAASLVNVYLVWNAGTPDDAIQQIIEGMLPSYAADDQFSSLSMECCQIGQQMMMNFAYF